MTTSNGLPNSILRPPLLAKMRQLDEQACRDDRELCRTFDAILAQPLSPLDRELQLAEAHLAGAERSLLNRDAYCELAKQIGDETMHLRTHAMVLGLRRVIEEVRLNLRNINSLIAAHGDSTEERHA